MLLSGDVCVLVSLLLVMVSLMVSLAWGGYVIMVVNVLICGVCIGGTSESGRAVVVKAVR